MPSQRALAGVTHDIAHHAESSVSFVHPHLYQACRAAGVREATVDLLEFAPYPRGLPQIEPLRLSLIALKDTFFAILSANGFSPSDVAAATLLFQFPQGVSDGYTCKVVARLESSRGRHFTATPGGWAWPGAVISHLVTANDSGPMSEDDRLREEDLDATHAGLRRMYHRSMTAAVLGGLFFAVVCALAMYFVPATRSIGAAVVVGVLIWLFFGVPLALSWWLHYRSPFQQLAQLRRRILAGEAVYASEVDFRRESKAVNP